jgi:hypothetical protein
VRGGERDHLGVELERPREARAHRDSAAAPAEGDAAVGVVRK